MIKESWGELSGCLESAVQAKTEVLLKRENDWSHHIKHNNRFPPVGMVLMWNSFQPPLYIVFDNIGSCWRHVLAVRRSELEFHTSQAWK